MVAFRVNLAVTKKKKFSPEKNYIGKHNGTLNILFTNHFDMIHIYNVVRTDAEIFIAERYRLGK